MCNRLMIVAELLGQNRLTRQALIGQEYTEIIVDLRSTGGLKSFAQAFGLILIRVAAAIENRHDLKPARPWKIWPINDLALDALDAIVAANTEHGRHLGRCCLRAAGGIGPGHEMVAAQTSLANDVLERDVGGVRHRGLERAAEHAFRRVRS